MSKMKERWAELEQAAEDAVYSDSIALPFGRKKFNKAANPAAILELLEVTKGLAEALHCFHRDYIAVHDVGDVEMQPAIYQARAALAKYEGVQSE